MMNYDYDTLVIGAGPGGLQCGYYLKKNNRKYVILEKAEKAASTFTQFPRYKYLISINKVWTGETDYEKNLRWDWNSLLHDEEDLSKMKLFKEYTQDYFPENKYLVEYMRDYADTFDLNIMYNTKVDQVSKIDGIFHIRVGDKVMTAKTVICCNGFRNPHVPNVPGFAELTEPYTSMPNKPMDYMGQDVLIIGKGNSGFETAEALTGTTSLIHIVSPDPLSFAWKTHYVGDLRAVYNNFLDTYQLKSQNAVLDALVTGMRRTPCGKKIAVDLEYAHAMGEKETLTYDRVLNCTGFVFDHSIFDETCKPLLNHGGKYPKQTCLWESSNVEGLHFGGSLMHEQDYKKNTSGFIHGFRYNCRILIKQLEKIHHGVEFPYYDLPCNPQGVMDAVVARINRCSVMWQQFGFCGDVIIVDQKKNTAKYYEEFTLDQIKSDKFVTRNNHYYTVSLEFNKVCGDPFNIQRAPTPENAETSIFLHPVIRHYNNGRLLNTLHILEDLYTNWTHPVQHLAPMKAFFNHTFTGKSGFMYNMKAKM